MIPTCTLIMYKSYMYLYHNHMIQLVSQAQLTHMTEELEVFEGFWGESKPSLPSWPWLSTEFARLRGFVESAPLENLKCRSSNVTIMYMYIHIQS